MQGKPQPYGTLRPPMRWAPWGWSVSGRPRLLGTGSDLHFPCGHILERGRLMGVCIKTYVADEMGRGARDALQVRVSIVDAR